MASDLDIPHKSEVEILEDFIGSAVKSMYREKGKMTKDVSVSIEVDLVGDLPTSDELEGLTLDQAVEKLETDELTTEVLLGYLLQKEAEEKIANGEADESDIIALDNIGKAMSEDSESTVRGYDLSQFSAFDDPRAGKNKESEDERE